MEYSIKDLIGMINLAIIIANNNGGDDVKIPKLAASEIRTYLENFNLMIDDLENFNLVVEGQ